MTDHHGSWALLASAFAPLQPDFLPPELPRILSRNPSGCSPRISLSAESCCAQATVVPSHVKDVEPDSILSPRQSAARWTAAQNDASLINQTSSVSLPLPPCSATSASR